MNGVITAIVVVSVIGLACGIMLSAASKALAVPVDETFEKVRACLPGANCGACGFNGCDDYANALASGNCTEANRCTPGGNEAAEGIAKVLGLEAGNVEPMVARVRCRGNCENSGNKYEWQGEQSCKNSLLLFGGKNDCIYGCLGYGDCAAVCPQDAICIKDGIAHVRQEYCIGCGMCAKTCPSSVMEMIPAKAKYLVKCNNATKGREAMTVCKASCIGCQKCVKTCPFEAIEFHHNLASINQDKCRGCGKCAKACPRGCIVKLDPPAAKTPSV